MGEIGKECTFGSVDSFGLALGMDDPVLVLGKLQADIIGGNSNLLAVG